MVRSNNQPDIQAFAPHAPSVTPTLELETALSEAYQRGRAAGLADGVVVGHGEPTRPATDDNSSDSHAYPPVAHDDPPPRVYNGHAAGSDGPVTARGEHPTYMTAIEATKFAGVSETRNKYHFPSCRLLYRVGPKGAPPAVKAKAAILCQLCLRKGHSY